MTGFFGHLMSVAPGVYSFYCESVPIRAHFLPILQAGWPTGWLVGWPAASNASGTPKCIKNVTLNTKVRRKCIPLSRKSISNRVGWRVEGVKNAYP